MTSRSLAETLVDRLGTDQVRTGATVLDSYSHDAWPISVVLDKLGRHLYRPDVVVTVRSVADVVATLAAGAAHGAPVTAWGLGSSVTGQPLSQAGGIVLDTSELVSEPVLDETNRIVSVAAGVQGGQLESWLAARGYTLNHTPQSLYRSSVGGWIATRATGQFSSKYGGIEHLVHGYEAVLADGTVVEFVQRPRAAMGPDLRVLLIGSEGTLGIVTHVQLRVFRTAEHRTVEAFAMPSVDAALDAVRTGYQMGLRPFLVRIYDTDEARHVAADETFAGVLVLCGSEGPKAVATAEHAGLVDILIGAGGRSLGEQLVERWFANRYDFSGVERLLAEPGGYAETIEVANLWSRLPGMYRDLKVSLAPLADEVLAHFSHVYDQGASLYVILRGHAPDDVAALDRLERIWSTAMDVVTRHDGELSHHHGGGLARQPYVRRSLGSGFGALERLKQALDPTGMLNPGKLGLGTPTVLAARSRDSCDDA